MPSTNNIFRIMHMADLHLGKSLRSRDLSEDQMHILAQVVAAARQLEPDLVVVAGDVFDRSIPSESAQTMLGQFMADMRRALSPEAKILIIPGNHDSPRRVAFAAELFESVGIHLVSEVKNEPAVVIRKHSSSIAVWAVPFVTHGLYHEFRRKSAEADHGSPSPSSANGGDGSMASRMGEIFAAFRPHFPEYDINIVVAHCYVHGASLSESDSDFLGGSEAVPVDLFEGFNYAALGHLHRAQHLSDTVWYAGAPMAMSFGDDEGGKGVLGVELDIQHRTPHVTPIALEPLRKFRRVRGSFAALTAATESADTDYIEAVLTDENPVYNAFNGLTARFPNLMSVRQEAFEKLARGFDLGADRAGDFSGRAGEFNAESSPDRRLGLHEVVLQDFKLFSAFILDTEPTEELERRFVSLLHAVEEEDRI